MNIQANAIAAPVLREALSVGNDTVLYVHNLNGPAHGEVATYANAAVGDVIEFTVAPSQGEQWHGKHTVASAIGPFIFKIPKSVFGEKPVSGATATLNYSVTTANGRYWLSPALVLFVKY